MELYDAEWRAYREVFLRTNPQCYVCGVEATEVDHIKAHRGDEKLFRQLDNHVPLCASCHSRATQLFDKNPTSTSTQDKIQWMQWTRAANGLSFKVKVLPKYQK